MHRGDQLLGPGIFEQEATCPGAERTKHVLVQLERCQHEDPDCRLRRHDPPGRLDAVKPGHPDVQHGYVGLVPGDELQGLLAAAGLPYDPQVGVLLQHVVRHDVADLAGETQPAQLHARRACLRGEPCQLRPVPRVVDRPTEPVELVAGQLPVAGARQHPRGIDLHVQARAAGPVTERDHRPAVGLVRPLVVSQDRAEADVAEIDVAVAPPPGGVEEHLKMVRLPLVDDVEHGVGLEPLDFGLMPGSIALHRAELGEFGSIELFFDAALGIEPRQVEADLVHGLLDPLLAPVGMEIAEDLGGPDLQVDLRVTAEHLLLDPASTANTAVVREALIAAADALAGFRPEQVAIAGEGTGAAMMPQFHRCA